jgi:hypothetical protein
MCQKVQYSCYQAALDAAKGLGKNRKGSFRVYKCGICPDGTFHLSSVKKKSLHPTKKKYRDTVMQHLNRIKPKE